jgi:hypothetical protein
MVMATLNHVDGVNLHVTEMLDRLARRLSTRSERRDRIEALRAKPDAAGLDGIELVSDANK